jgi:uncharacterized membrane protein
MGYRLAALAVLLVHLAFIVFVVAGAALAWRRRWLLAFHLPAAAWGVWIELSGGDCPLTGAENALRMRGGLAGYGEGFVEHYLLRIVYPEALSRNSQYVLAAAVLGINVILYGLILSRPARLTHSGRVEVPPADDP